MDRKLLKNAALRKIIGEKGMRIGSENLDALSQWLGKIAEEELEQVLRKTRLSGRKTVYKEDWKK